MQLPRLSRASFPVLCVLAACQEGSSGAPGSEPVATNLRLAAFPLIGGGDHWLLSVSEEQQGADLDGDFDRFDLVLHQVDLTTGRVRNLGLVNGVGLGRGDVAPTPLVGFGSAFAVGAHEFSLGAVDLNGDGDGFDDVLVLVDPATGHATNLRLAMLRVAVGGDHVAFDVPEDGQGTGDLNGNGFSDVVPHVFDLVTGETINTRTSAMMTVGTDDRFVALAEFEAGDRNGDGDARDKVLAFYDVEAGTVASTGLALFAFVGPLFTGPIVRPIAHRGRWVVRVGEADQGAGDLDGDGNPSGIATFVVDPATGAARNMLALEFQPLPDVAPFVFLERGDAAFMPWLYDADADTLVRTGWWSVNVQSFGDQLLLTVSEALQSEDLDGDGALRSRVPIVYDPATAAVRISGVDGSIFEVGRPVAMLSSEERADRDLNGDGDHEDSVLHTWDVDAGQVTNTGIAADDVASFSDGLVLFLRNEEEAGADLNGDDDRSDDVAHVYDATTARATNLHLAGSLFHGLGATAARAFLSVDEFAQGADLDGDGDRSDFVLFLVSRPGN